MPELFPRPYHDVTTDELAPFLMREIYHLQQEGREVHLRLDIAHAWAMIASLQLAISHPGVNGPVAAAAHAIAEFARRQFISPGSAMEEAYLRGERDAAKPASAAD